MGGSDGRIDGSRLGENSGKGDVNADGDGDADGDVVAVGWTEISGEDAGPVGMTAN